MSDSPTYQQIDLAAPHVVQRWAGGCWTTLADCSRAIALQHVAKLREHYGGEPTDFRVEKVGACTK